MIGSSNNLPELIKKYSNRYKLVKDEFHCQTVEWIDGVVTLEMIKNDVDCQCPACILSILRQCKLGLEQGIEFDFKKELEGVWSDINESNVGIAGY